MISFNQLCLDVTERHFCAHTSEEESSLCKLAAELVRNFVCPLLNPIKLRISLLHKSGTEIACQVLGTTYVPMAIEGNNTTKIRKRSIKLLKSVDKKKIICVKSNFETCSCKQFCSGREIRICIF